MGELSRQLIEQLDRYLKADTSNWEIGLRLINSLSKTGADVPDLYERGITKISSIKPAIKGREDRFFLGNVALPMERVKQIVDKATKDTFCNVTMFSEFANNKRTKVYDPPIIENLDDLKIAITSILGDKVGLFSKLNGRRFLTFGSCFANNIGMALKDRGASVYTMMLTEDINSTFNNRLWLRKVFLNEDSNFSRELETTTGIDYRSIYDEFGKATDIIFTLGNIFHVENDKGPALVSRKGTHLVSESIAQTMHYLTEIMNLLHRHTSAKVYVTVSPIPISGYRGEEYQNAFEADCASKCQLLTALRACQFRNVTYLPIFEIFKWLPPHQKFSTFGGDDGRQRHISQSHISLVMEALC